MEFSEEGVNTHIDSSSNFAASTTEADLPDFADTFNEVEEFASSPIVPVVKKERRYSGMEIPFGVIETGSNVNGNVNPMIRGNSKRMSMLRPEKEEEDVPFGVSDRYSTVHDENPLRKYSGKFQPLRSDINKQPVGDDIPFGVNENPGGLTQLNPMRLSGKYTRSSSGSPLKAETSKSDLQNMSSSPPTTPTTTAMDTATSNDGKTTDTVLNKPSRITKTALGTELSSIIHKLFLFIYMLCDILYELAMDLIKKPKNS